MKEILGAPAVVVISPVAAGITSAATASGTFDAQGAGHATILVMRGQAAGTAGSGSTTTISLLQSDNTNSSTFATYVANVTVAADTSVGKLVRYEVDLKGRKRYQKITITPGTTAAATNDTIAGTAIVLLSRESNTPTASAALADTVVIVTGQGTVGN